MKIAPSKLVAARLAAADVFIAEGLEGTNWDRPDEVELFRSLAQKSCPWVRYGAAPAAAIVRVSEQHGRFSVRVDPREMRMLSPEQAAEAVFNLNKATDVARKVEAAIAEAAS